MTKETCSRVSRRLHGSLHSPQHACPYSITGTSLTQTHDHTVSLFADSKARLLFSGPHNCFCAPTASTHARTVYVHVCAVTQYNNARMHCEKSYVHCSTTPACTVARPLESAFTRSRSQSIIAAVCSATNGLIYVLRTASRIDIHTRTECSILVLSRSPRTEQAGVEAADGCPTKVSPKTWLLKFHCVDC